MGVDPMMQRIRGRALEYRMARGRALEGETGGREKGDGRTRGDEEEPDCTEYVGSDAEASERVAALGGLIRLIVVHHLRQERRQQTDRPQAEFKRSAAPL